MTKAYFDLNSVKSFQAPFSPNDYSTYHLTLRGRNFILALCRVLKLVSNERSLILLSVGISNSEWSKWHFATLLSERVTAGHSSGTGVGGQGRESIRSSSSGVRRSPLGRTKQASIVDRELISKLRWQAEKADFYATVTAWQIGESLSQRWSQTAIERGVISRLQSRYWLGSNFYDRHTLLLIGEISYIDATVKILFIERGVIYMLQSQHYWSGSYFYATEHMYK